MPYTGPGDESLPENVKKLDEGKRAQWVEVWNSAHKKCMDDGGDSKTCEASAFAQANGAVKGGNRAMDIKELWERVKAVFASAIEERASYPWDQCVADQMKKYGSKDKAEKICGAIKAKYGGRSEGNDIMLPDGFDLAKALTELEKEFQIEPARMIAYLPTQTRSLVITRNAQGIPRWLMIAASAVVNKVGAIDSTTLFDNFIRHASETSEYPVLDFFHEGERIRFGVADWLRRDGALYLASGTFDDTELGRGAADGLETQPDYWGGSIAYRVTEPPLMLVSEGEIPVYTDGVNNFISIVPRRMAANLFTATLVAEEVRRMNKATYDELVKLVGAERAAQFADQVDDANRTITETGMITRAEEPTPAVPVAEVVPEPTPAAPEQVRQDSPPADMPKMDLAQMQAMMEAMDARLKKLEESYGTGMEESKRTQERATTEMAGLVSRLAAVEASKERWDTWLNDAPEYVKAEADKIYRARDQEPAPMTMAQLAQENVSRLHNGPHQRRGS